MRGDIPPLPNTPSWHGAQLKHRDNFYIYIHIHLCIQVVMLSINLVPNSRMHGVIPPLPICVHGVVLS
jgi:hypothetical protein